MNQKQKKRFICITSIIILMGGALGLILYALQQNINLFYTPTELMRVVVNPQQVLRIGGYVKKNSIHYGSSGQSVKFIVTDHVRDVSVNYHGVLPNLFREEQGVVVTGSLDWSHSFIATQVLAKHDEKYMPWSLEKKLQAGVHHDS